MKKNLTLFLAMAVLTVSLSSCYVNKFNIGSGAPANYVKVKKWNHYLIDGLIPIGTANPQIMAAGAKDYTVIIKQTLLDLILAGITGGIYTPTITIVRK